MIGNTALIDEPIETLPRGVRFAVFDQRHDPADAVELARLFHEESRFAQVRFAPDKVEAIVARAVARPEREAILMAWQGTTPVGALFCSAGEYLIGRGAVITTFQAFYVRPEVRKTLLGGRVILGLMKGIERWAKARNSVEILFHTTSGDAHMPGTHRLVQRLGYRLIGGSYGKNCAVKEVRR